MKHLENRDRTMEYEALELRQVPDLIEKRLQELYRELPDELPMKRRNFLRILRPYITSAAACAAALALVLGVNAAFPAFAEGLPLVGGIFRQLNAGRHYSFQNEEKTARQVQALAEPTEGEPVCVPAANLLEKPVEVSVGESYYDGVFLYVGLSMKTDCRDELLVESGENRDISINGKEMVLRDENGGWLRYAQGFVPMDMNGLGNWYLSEDGSFLSQKAFCLPEELWGEETLHLEISLKGICNEQGDMLNSSSFVLPVELKKQEASVQEINTRDLEAGNVRLVKAVNSPAGSAYILEYGPEYQNPACGLAFENGSSLGILGDSFPETLSEGTTRITRVAGAVEKGETRKIVFSVLDKNGTDEYPAVFLLDFENGSASLGSSEDVKTIPSLIYQCGREALQSFEGTHKIAQAILKDQGSLLALDVASTDETPRDLKIRFSQGERVLREQVYEGSRQENFENYQYREMPFAEGEAFDTSFNGYSLFASGMESIDPEKPLTIRVTDAETGELLDEETISMTQMDS